MDVTLWSISLLQPGQAASPTCWGARRHRELVHGPAAAAQRVPPRAGQPGSRCKLCQPISWGDVLLGQLPSGGCALDLLLVLALLSGSVE